MLAAVMLAVPNVSEGHSDTVIDRVAAGFAPARVLDRHSDADHHRTVLWLAAGQRELAKALASGARAAAESIDLTAQNGVHPRVGALDVAPVVYRDAEERGAATATALTAAALIGELGIPVFLYGELATDPSRVERSELRRGGPERLGERMAAGELAPDYGPDEMHPTAGATLVTARPPLVAFNVDLDSTDLALATTIAAELRENRGGLPGVRALGLWLDTRGRVQVSMNVHDYTAAPLPAIIERIAARAPIAEAELVGLAPAAALADFPADIPLRNRRTIEDALDRSQSS
jgi:glutamate formiminotransferase / 5-formyltetrahydrofolate cyclo-ligase